MRWDTAGWRLGWSRSLAGDRRRRTLVIAPQPAYSFLRSCWHVQLGAARPRCQCSVRGRQLARRRPSGRSATPEAKSCGVDLRAVGSHHLGERWSLAAGEPPGPMRIRPAHAWRRRASAFVHFLLARGDGEQRCATCGFALDGAIYAC